MNNQITYKLMNIYQEMNGWKVVEDVFLEGKLVGSIHKRSNATYQDYQYVPKGQRPRQNELIFSTLNSCKDSIEEE